MSMLETWMQAHPWVYPLIVGLAAAVVNTMLRFKTAAEWIAYGEARPWGAAGIRILRALFPDPVKAINAFVEALNAKSGGGGSPPAAKPETPGIEKRDDLMGFTSRPMQLAGALAFCLGFGGTFAAGAPGCLPNGQVNWPAVEQAVDIACLLRNAFLPTEEVTFRLCNVAPDAIPIARRVIGEHKAGVRRAFERAGAPPPPWAVEPADAGGAL